MSLTDAELEGIAAQAANMAKRDIEQERFNFLLATYHVGDEPPLHRMDRIEKLIVERLGPNWLNSGRTKDIGFKTLRIAIDLMPPEAVVIVTACNGFALTAKFYELPEDEQEKLKQGPHDRHHEAAKEGLLEMKDILLATVQTPERICFYEQEYDHGKFVGRPSVRCGPMDGFDGRLKMFGEVSDRAFSKRPRS